MVERMDFARIKVLTFDCYGTLIDWEAGILAAIREAFPGLAIGDAEILKAYSEIEPVLQATAYREYRTILREVLTELGRRFGREPVRRDLLAESLPSWKPFADTVPALEVLGRRFRLAIISNIDDDLFAGTARALKVPFAEVVTAQQVRSYKPSLRNFQEALARLKVRADRVLHVAESLFHDVAPARRLGIATVWVNRARDDRSTASKRVTVEPDLMVRSLEELVCCAKCG